MKLLCWMMGVLMLVGCTTTEEKSHAPKGNPYVIGAPICVAWVHDSIANSTGDYQACKYNHRGYEQGIEQCMEARGWRRENSERACNIKSYSLEQRQSCLNQSIVGGKVDHSLIKRCLAVYTPKAQAPINQAKLQQMIGQCMNHKNRATQQQCLNDLMKKN